MATNGRKTEETGRTNRERTREDTDEAAGETTFETYRNDEYGYRIAYPADWSVEAESGGGTSFDDPRSSAGATVSLDVRVGITPVKYVKSFLGDLTADEHVRALEIRDRRELALNDGECERAIDGAYATEPRGERWRLTYLFVLDGEAGYVVGVDGNDGDGLDDLATRIVESFAVDSDRNGN